MVNAASNQTGAIAPGEIVVIYGSGLGPAQLVAPQAVGGAGPVQFDSVVASVGGTPAQIVYVSAGQVSAIVPAGVAGPNAQISVQYLGQTGAPVSVPVAAASPALFTLNASGSGQALAVNADGSLNGSTHPAARGSNVTLFVNGVPSQFLAGPVAVTLGGQPAAIVNVAPATSAPGVTAITVQIPSGLSAAAPLPVAVQVGPITSPAGVTLTVGAN